MTKESEEEKEENENDEKEDPPILLNYRPDLKNKQKMSTSSSFETEVCRSKSSDNLTNQLISILPQWGGKVKINEKEKNLLIKYNNFKIVDICTIDYFLMAISFSGLINDKSTPLFIKTSAGNNQ